MRSSHAVLCSGPSDGSITSTSGRQEEAHAQRIPEGSPHLDIFEPRPVLSGGLEAVLGQQAESLGSMPGLTSHRAPSYAAILGGCFQLPHRPCMPHHKYCVGTHVMMCMCNCQCVLQGPPLSQFCCCLQNYMLCIHALCKACRLNEFVLAQIQLGCLL